MKTRYVVSGFSRTYAAVLAAVALLVALAVTGDVYAQFTPFGFARGQDVSPTFDGWERNPDGTYSMYFGYYNRNTEEEFDVQVGADNGFDVGGPDRGQPTHFYASRKWWVFKTVVPADWPKDRRLTWTLTTHGKTNSARGWLQPEWEVDQKLIAKNSGRDPSLMTNPSNTLDADATNLPPAITITGVRAVKVGETLSLTATAADDGKPAPVPDPDGKLQQGVRVRWIVYRGAGQVRFQPDIMPNRIHGKPAALSTNVTFTRAGTYRLRAIASDGMAFSTNDVDVTVQ
jgi:hypothetical protein